MDINFDKAAAFENTQRFWDWLAEHQASETEIWLKIYKKSSDIPTVSWDEAVIAAIAWGWIDGVKKSHDDLAYFQRFTPRKKNSAWSKRNRGHAENLILQGRMQAPGLAAVELARASGRWDVAYAGSADMEIPADFLHALKSDAQAQAFYKTLNRANLFSIYHRLHTAKKPQTRQDRMAKILDKLAKGETFH